MRTPAADPWLVAVQRQSLGLLQEKETTELMTSFTVNVNIVYSLQGSRVVFNCHFKWLFPAKLYRRLGNSPTLTQSSEC